LLESRFALHLVLVVLPVPLQHLLVEHLVDVRLEDVLALLPRVRRLVYLGNLEGVVDALGKTTHPAYIRRTSHVHLPHDAARNRVRVRLGIHSVD
jgi:hypothetical protein